MSEQSQERMMAVIDPADADASARIYAACRDVGFVMTRALAGGGNILPKEMKPRFEALRLEDGAHVAFELQRGLGRRR